ncbi:MAG: helix-turn-helix domain-containing protein [Acidiferrobacterales bacterium]|nr:helix-turn-helix domain-containing protein [Acidiferrobacterales bacterium]
MLEQLKHTQLLAMYDLLPDILFWVKDQQGRFVYVNNSFVERVGASSREQLIGRTDFDFSPMHLAKQFAVDDERVLNGQAVTDRLEMNLDEDNEIAWFTTSKRPLLNESGDIVGSYGVSRHLEKTSVALLGLEALKGPIKFIRANYANDISLNDIADVAHLSISALERRFKKHIARTPLQYLTDVRLENARRLLLETNRPIADVAFESGFNDASYFSRRFKRKFSLLPSEFRSVYAAG